MARAASGRRCRRASRFHEMQFCPRASDIGRCHPRPGEVPHEATVAGRHLPRSRQSQPPQSSAAWQMGRGNAAGRGHGWGRGWGGNHFWNARQIRWPRRLVRCFRFGPQPGDRHAVAVSARAARGRRNPGGPVARCRAAVDPVGCSGDDALQRRHDHSAGARRDRPHRRDARISRCRQRRRPRAEGHERIPARHRVDERARPRH